MKAPVNSRYAHCDGHCDIALFDDGCDGKIVTCGSDGDIRVWACPDDKNPIVFAASENGLGLACHKNTLYVGTENNTVESFTLPSGTEEKVVAKFTAAVNHVDVSKSGNILVAGSGDMTIQIIKLNETSPPTKIEGHTAPVLSIVIDPLEEFFVSSGCDGCVSIWNLGSGKQVKSWDGVFPSSNDISTSKTLCRPSFKGDGSLVAVPIQNTVILYSRSAWREESILKVSGSNKILSVTQFSSCGKYLVAGSTDGTIFVWDITTSKLIYENADTTNHITGVIFSKSGKDLLAVDLLGRLIFVNDFLAAHDSQNQDIDMDDELSDRMDNLVEKGAVADDDHDPFDDDMDDLFGDAGDQEGNDDDNEISISKIKAMTGFISSENDKEDVFVGVDRAKKIAGIKNVIEDDDDDDGHSVSSSRGSRSKQLGDCDQEKPQPSYRPVPIEMPFTVPQEPFQPSSSPIHLQQRFMVWNDLGLIKNFGLDNDEADAINNINIEFHDVSFHSLIHLRNQNNYTLAALSKEAAIFASSNSKSSGGLSKIMCYHFSSWDNSKEWSTDLPRDEEATTIAIGTGWFAVGTSMNRLRIFTIGGVQRNILDIGGQIIAISGYEDLLFVTFHSGIGLHGNQHISYTIIRVRSGTGLFPLVSSEPLPLSPKSKMTWVGFSDEGTPTVTDSTETVRILNGRMWTTFLSMKSSSRIDSEHYWLTGLSVCNQQIRAVKCKGTRYPPILPRPTVLLLDAKLSLCEMETEKSQMEDILLRSMMQNALSKKLDKKGIDVEDYRDTAEKDIKENLMKLFAICCKGDKDFRASEYGGMLPSTHSIQVAIKYANKLRKMALTDHLTAIARKKLDEDEDGIEEDDDDFENMRSGNVIYSSMYSTLGNPGTPAPSSGPLICSSTGGSSLANDSCDVIFYEENPLLTRQRAEISAMCSASPANYKNPFKKDGASGNGELKTASTDINKTEHDSKGLSLIDAWKKPAEKLTLENAKPSKTRNSKKGSDKDKSEKPCKAVKNSNKYTAGKKQTTLFAMAGRKSTDKDKEKQPESPVTTVDDENSNVSTNCESEEADSENVEPENIPVIIEKKRKRSGHNDDDTPEETEKKSRISSKLSAFSLRRKSVDTEDNELADI